MKPFILPIALLCSIITCNLRAADTFNLGAMNSDWFSTGGQKGAYKKANDLQNKQKFEKAKQAYSDALNQDLGSEYDQDMARLNRAACWTAQGEFGVEWATFDAIHNRTKDGIEEQRLVGKAFPENHVVLRGTTVVVTEDGAGIGDDFHFFALLNMLRYRGCRVVFALSNERLIATLQSAANKQGIKLVKYGSPEQLNADYQTHLFALFGHLIVEPNELRPTEAIHYPLKRADGTEPIDLVLKLVDNILNEETDNEVMFLHVGEASRPCIVPGGKMLTNRHLSDEPINTLLRKYPKLHVFDMGTICKTTTFIASPDVASRVFALPEDKSFDTILAAALIMRERDRTLSIHADSGPGNVFESNVGGKCPKANKAAADRTATIAFTEQHDWRMNGSEDTSDDYQIVTTKKEVTIEKYRHLLAAGLVFRGSRANEAEIIEQAYLDMSTVNK